VSSLLLNITAWNVVLIFVLLAAVWLRNNKVTITHELLKHKHYFYFFQHMKFRFRIPLEAWMCVRLFCVVFSCVGRGLASGRFPVQGVLANVQLLTYIPTPWCRILIQKLIVTQLVKKSHFLTEPEGSSPCSKKPATGTYSEPAESSSPHLSLSP
jgi:hypothetical protein